MIKRRKGAENSSKKIGKAIKKEKSRCPKGHTSRGRKGAAAKKTGCCTKEKKMAEGAKKTWEKRDPRR